MIRYENECVGPCPQGCMGSACRYRNVPHFYCDYCHDECDPEDLYYYEGDDMYCKDCILAQFEKVSV